MGSLPIRIRVTLAFTAVMALVLAGIGLFLYERLGSQLDESIDNGLRTRAGEVSALAVASERGVSGSAEAALIESEESFAQVLTPAGDVIDSTPQLGGTPVLAAPDLERAAGEPTFFERESLPGVEGAARLLASPVETTDGTVVAVVGSSLDDRDEATAGLATLLLIGGPVGLLLASLAGYWVAGAALRPVEAMRRRAAEISAGDPGERLPVPPAEDELGRLGATLNEMLARLEAAIERERRFVDDASHELRTPLALHRAELELALRYGEDAPELRRAIASAIEEVDRLVALAEALLVVARTGDGDLPITRDPVSVGDLFTTVVERFRTRAAHAQRPLVVGDGADLVVAGDRLRLEQALTGLVDNALRHGGGEIRVWAQELDGEVTIHVVDHGPGFPDGFRAHAFERFSRADPARTGAGAGLGLAIVETIARAHGGSAAAANLPQGGADVSITLGA